MSTPYFEVFKGNAAPRMGPAGLKKIELRKIYEKYLSHQGDFCKSKVLYMSINFSYRMLSFKNHTYLIMSTTRTFHFICVIALALGLSACGTTGAPTASAPSAKQFGVIELPAKNSMGKAEPVSILQVPVISITELTKPKTTQTQKCVAKADDTKPVVGGAISDSQVCVNSSSTEIVKVFKVVYELSGSQYAVELPENPGPYIQLQITATPSQNSSTSEGVTVVGETPGAVVYQYAAIAPALAYPYVFYSGAFYRPVPIFLGARYRYGGGYRISRGRRH